MHAPSEIRQFDFAVDADEDVLGLDVSMDDVFFVQVLEGGSHLSNVLEGKGSQRTTAEKKKGSTNLSSPRLRKALRLLEHLVELALAGKLQDEKDALRIVEMAVQL